MEERKILLKEETRQIQSNLASYCKSGRLTEIEGARTERLPNYRRLVFNIIFDIMSNAYPISRQIFDNKWKGFIERFFEDHNCSHYQVWKLPEELLIYVQKNKIPEKIEFPFLENLLEFEWLEIVVYNETDKKIEVYFEAGDWKKNKIVLNPHYRLLQLEYPIHKIAAEKSIAKKGNFHVLMFRDLKKLQVRFIELPAFFNSVLFEFEKSKNLKIAVEDSAKKFEFSDMSILFQKTDEWVALMIRKGFILGFEP